MPKHDRVIASLRSRRLDRVRSELSSDPDAARSAQVVLEAARLGWKEALALLVRRGADPNAPWRGYRPLHALLQERVHGDPASPPSSRVACLAWLLSHGADPERTAAFPPARALIIAAFVGAPEYVAALRDAGARVDGFVAAALGDLRSVARRLERDPALATARDVGGLTALQCCAGSGLGARDAKVRRGLLEIAGLLLDSGADPNAQTKAWSHEVDVAYFAASAGQRELFGLLLERGADATAALPSAVWRCGTELAEMALAHGADPDRATHGEKPVLNELIRWGQVRPALWLLGRGASPNVSDERGWTAVHQAASRGNERMLAATLEAGGDRKRRDREGRTPLDVARAVRRPKIVALLTA